MKNIIKIICAGFFLTCFVACELNEFPKAVASREFVFGSASGLELYVNRFYEFLPSTYDGVFLDDDHTDLFAGRVINDRFIANQLSPANVSGWTSGSDQYQWGRLRHINYFIHYCEQSSVPGKEHYLGIARFSRAYFYYEMVKRWGDVPWVDKIIEVDDADILYGPRDSRFVVMDKVLEDLDYAIANINIEHDGTRTRISKNVARAFKSRVCLYEGSLRKYHTSYNMQNTANAWFQEAVSAANAVTGYSLRQGATAYRDMFLQKSPYLDETILCVALDGDLQLFSSRNRKTISPTYGNRPAFTRRFVLTYLNADGTSFTMSNPNWKTTPYVDEIKDRDPRLGQSIRKPDYTRTAGGVRYLAPPNLEQSITGYQIIKGCYDEQSPYDAESRNENAHLIFRYAEVLLNKAEALVELNGTLTAAEWTETIGALRARAGITGSTLTTVPTVADTYMVDFYNGKWTNPVMLEVLRERAVELVQEGVRADDLIRWRLGELFTETPFNGMYIPALGVYDFNGDGINEVCFYQGARPDVQATFFMDVSPTTAAGSRTLSEGASGEIIWYLRDRTWNDKLYLYPVPQSQRLLNPQLGQNPGW